MVTARVGNSEKIVADRWTFRGRELYAGYDTRQVFRADYEHAAHSVLPPPGWEPAEPAFLRWKRELRAAMSWSARAKPPPKPKRPEVAAIMRLPADRRVPMWQAWARGEDVAALLEGEGMLAPC
jgi:hypothetical protein